MSRRLNSASDRDEISTWLVTVPVALIVIYAFVPIVDNGFVVWDDEQNFLYNPHFRGLGPAQLKWAWTTFWVGAYQPLAWLLFEAQYVLCGLDPRGYHLTSLLLQVANAVVLYALTVALLVRCRADSCLETPWTCSLCAGLMTALFAVHPLRVEAVAWASCQPYLPCILFSMFSVLAYLRAFPTESPPLRGWLTASFLLFVTSLLFKAVAVSLPAVLLILDVYPLRRFPDKNGRWFGAAARRALVEKVPFVITSLLFMRLAIAAKPQSELPVEQYGAWLGITRACYATWFYVAKTVLPVDLIAYYQAPLDMNWRAPEYFLSILATLAVTAGLFRMRRRWPAPLAAWLSYLAILAPNSGFIRISELIAADRYSYMAMLGSVMLAAAGLCRLGRISSRWHPGAPIGIIAIGLGVLVGLTALTRQQCRTWRDSEILWTHTLAAGGNANYVAHTNLGTFLYTHGKLEAAEAHYIEAVRLRPGYAETHKNLANLLLSQNKFEAAEAHYAEAVRLRPGYAEAHKNLGNILSMQKRYEAAATHLTQALWFDPDDASALRSLGNVLYAQGKYEEAAARFTQALKAHPDFADAQNSLAMIRFHQKRYAEAQAHFTEAVRLNPGNADLYNNLGTVLARQHRYAEAMAQFALAVRLSPDFEIAHFNLGRVHAELGHYEAAAAHYTEAIRLQPGHVGAHFNLGNVLSRQGNYEAAKAQYAEAIRLDPDYAEAYNASALLMAACPEAKFRDGQRAVASATRACELTKWKDPRVLNTLAAAQAEAGEFALAEKSQATAIDLLTDDRQKDDYRSRLVLYQAKRPFREASPQSRPTKASRPALP